MKPHRRVLIRVLAILAVLAGGLIASAPAGAAGTPDLAINAGASSPLYGETGTVSVTASLPDGQPKGYNLSFRVVLPQGVSYAGGAEFSPTVIANQPATGMTTLLFNNISDLVANSSQALNFNVTHDPAQFEVGSTYSIEYGAYVNSDPRIMPAFDAAGLPVAASSTGSATTSTTSRINAIKISKSEPIREGEILRGVHDHQTIYTLKLKNNLVNPVTRAFKIYNPTDHDLKARLSLLCLGLRTAGEHLPPKQIDNTAYISTVTPEEITANNSSTATVIAEDTDNHEPIDPEEPGKPTPNNPVAKTIVGKGVTYAGNVVVATIRCTGACAGTAKLVSTAAVRTAGKKFAMGTVLAAKRYFIGKAGTRKVKLKVTPKGRKILRSGKARKALLNISGGTRKVVKVGRRR